MSETEDRKFLWFKSAGLYKTYRRQFFFGFTVPVFCVLGAIGSVVLLFFFWKVALVGLLTLGAVGVSSYFYSDRVLFHQIFCPQCGYNPTRRKSDGEKRKDYYKFVAQMERFTECPNCRTTSGLEKGLSDDPGADE